MRPPTYQTLLGSMVSTGIRVSEAIRLKYTDGVPTSARSSCVHAEELFHSLYTQCLIAVISS